jgi:hypothetical protein
MASFDERIERLVQRSLDKAIEDTLQTLSAGNLTAHSDYKFHCGIIAGLRLSKEFLAQALSDIQRG